MSADGYAVADVLNRAADLLERDGWCQNTLENTQGERCALGAIRCADTGVTHWGGGELSAAGDSAFLAIGGWEAVAWNNAPTTTKQDVLDAFRAAAKDQMRAVDEKAGKP